MVEKWAVGRQESTGDYEGLSVPELGLLGLTLNVESVFD
jgi:hypothetical protein